MSWLTKLFGSSKSVDKVVETAADGIYNGLDKLIHTEEEKSDALAKGRDVFLSFVKIAYDQNSIRSVARRWLAFMVIGPTMLCFLLATGGYLFSMGFSDKMLQLFQVMIPWAGGILVFYFGPHLIGSMKK